MENIVDYFDDQFIFSVFFKGISWFQLLKCTHWLLFFVILNEESFEMG